MKKTLLFLSFVLFSMSVYCQKQRISGTHIMLDFDHCLPLADEDFHVDFDTENLTVSLTSYLKGKSKSAYFTDKDYCRLYYICNLPFSKSTRIYFLASLVCDYSSQGTKVYYTSVVPKILESWHIDGPEYYAADYKKDELLYYCLSSDFEPTLYKVKGKNCYGVDLDYPVYICKVYHAQLQQPKQQRQVILSNIRTAVDKFNKMNGGEALTMIMLSSMMNRGKKYSKSDGVYDGRAHHRNWADKGDYDNANGYK